MTSFTPIFNQEMDQAKLMAQRSKKRVYVRVYVRNRLKFCKISRMDENVKTGYGKFDHSGTLMELVEFLMSSF